jgi:DNA-binding winged helix-turn-helix (wHTH) protein
VQYLRVFVGQLRQKLEDDPTAPKLIETEPGVGYRVDAEGFQQSAPARSAPRLGKVGHDVLSGRRSRMARGDHWLCSS